MHWDGLKPPGPLALKDTLPDGNTVDPTELSVTVTVHVVAKLIGKFGGEQVIAAEEVLGRTINVNDPAVEEVLGECWASPW
jgi:hypothetical protein